MPPSTATTSPPATTAASRVGHQIHSDLLVFTKPGRPTSSAELKASHL
jgi:hypothetical protein